MVKMIRVLFQDLFADTAGKGASYSYSYTAREVYDSFKHAEVGSTVVFLGCQLLKIR